MLPLAAINELAKSLINVNEKNFAISVIMQEKDGKTAFTKAELPAIVEAARAEKVEPYVDNTKEEPMMLKEPKAGKIVSEKPLKQFDAKVLTLSNGAKVILKKTDLKANEILMMASAPGGKSIGKKESLAMRKLWTEISSIHGLGTKSLNDLANIAQTKMTNIEAGISNDLHYISGSTVNENVETLMQMINLSFTDIKKDENYYKLVTQYMKGKLETKASDPEMVMADSVAYYNHNKQLDALSPDVKDFDNINYDRALDLYRQLFNNASDFTFTFVGSFDEATIRPLIEKYIASIPVSKKKAELVDMRTYTKGKVQKSFSFKMSNPQSKIIDTYRSDKVAYTLENQLNARALGQYLWDKMFEIIREKESAVYTPMPSVSLEEDLTGNYITINCELATNPEKTEIAEKLAKEIIFDSQTKITNDDIARAKEVLNKKHTEAVKQNNYWLNVLSDYATYGVDRANGFDAVMKAMTPQTVGNIAKMVLKTGNHVQVIMNAEKLEK
jgi:peptidase M16 inactive domain protein